MDEKVDHHILNKFCSRPNCREQCQAGFAHSNTPACLGPRESDTGEALSTQATGVLKLAGFGGPSTQSACGGTQLKVSNLPTTLSAPNEACVLCSSIEALCRASLRLIPSRMPCT